MTDGKDETWSHAETSVAKRKPWSLVADCARPRCSRGTQDWFGVPREKKRLKTCMKHVLILACAIQCNQRTAHTYTHTLKKYRIITALHAMQTRSSDENTVRLSVCPPVCVSVTRVHCDKTVERSVQIYIPYERTFIPLLCEVEWLMGGDAFYVKFWVNRPPLERNRRFSTNNRS